MKLESTMPSLEDATTSLAHFVSDDMADVSRGVTSEERYTAWYHSLHAVPNFDYTSAVLAAAICAISEERQRAAGRN